AGVDEGLQVGADRLAALPVGDAKVADGIFRKTVKPLAEGLVVDLLPHIEQPLWCFFLRKYDLHDFLLDLCFCLAALIGASKRMIRKIVDWRLGSITSEVIGRTLEAP